MSYITIFKFNKDGDACEYSDIQNSWSGSPAIWNILEEKYLPMHISSYVKSANWYYEGMSNDEIIAQLGYKPTRFADMMHPEAMQEIWALANDDRVSAAEKICLYTTFDRVVVRKEYLPTVIWAFRQFNGTTSLPEQADILEELMHDDDCIAVAWHQNSISCDMWFPDLDDDDNEIPVNLNKGQKYHEKGGIWFIFEGNEMPELLGIEKQQN
jgi:hypothetical protein